MRIQLSNLVLLIAAASLCAGFQGCGKAPPPSRVVAATLAKRAEAPRDSMALAAFLQYLQSGTDAAALQEAFDVKGGGRWQPDSVLSFLSGSGVVFSDINRDSTWAVALTALRGELAAHTGRSFGTLVHLAYIAAQPYKQYRHLTFTYAGDSTIVNMADWYRILLVSERGSPRVRRIEYIMRELE